MCLRSRRARRAFAAKGKNEEIVWGDHLTSSFRNLRQQLQRRIDLAVAELVDGPLRIAGFVRERLLGHAAFTNVGVEFHSSSNAWYAYACQAFYASRLIHIGNYGR